MQLISFKVPRSNFKIFAVSDTHEGSELCYDKGRKEIYRQILLDKDAYLVHLGDVAEAIAVDDKRYDPSVTKGSPASQYIAVENELKPLADKGKIITILQGTHDWRWCRIWGDRVQELCDRLKVTYGTFSSKISLYTSKGNFLFKIYITHGHKLIHSIAQEPIMQEAYERSQVKRHLQHMAGDCLVMAKSHSHKLWVQSPIPTLYLTDDGTEEIAKYTTQGSEGIYIPPAHRWYVSTGSCVKSRGIGFSSYAERLELPPTDLGYARLDIVNKELVNILPVKL